MFVRSFLVVITAALALIGWFRPTPTPGAVVIGGVALIIAIGLLQLALEWQQAQERARAKYSGTLKAKR